MDVDSSPEGELTAKFVTINPGENINILNEYQWQSNQSCSKLQGQSPEKFSKNAIN